MRFRGNNFYKSGRVTNQGHEIIYEEKDKLFDYNSTDEILLEKGLIKKIEKK